MFENEPVLKECRAIDCINNTCGCCEFEEVNIEAGGMCEGYEREEQDDE